MNNCYSSAKILLIILIGTIVFHSNLFSQKKYERKISISEWVEEMENCEKFYFLENAEIYWDEQKDSLYAFWQDRSNPPSVKEKQMMKEVFPVVLISNCKIPSNKTSQLRNIIFHNNITFSQCEGALQYIFYNCTFKQGLDIQHSDFGILQFMFCSIKQRTVINNSLISTLQYRSCSFYTDSKVVKSPYAFGTEKENNNWQYLFNIRQDDKNIKSFNLIECTILPTTVKPVISFVGGKYDDINFSKIDFSNCIVDFTRCSVKEYFSVNDCKFRQPLGMYKFNIPIDNTSFNWSQLDSVGIGLYNIYEDLPYTHKTDTLISNVYYYNELSSSYRKFFSMYRTRGDIESANACYTQMKDMETSKYSHLYKEKPSVKSWFNWQFNQFLKYFSEYGTNPVQSLIISMWTILVFAAVYFFFYSDWDNINRAYLIKQHRKIMQYFRSEQRLEDFYAENYIEDFKTFAEYKKEMVQGRVEMPGFIVLLGKPLYLLSIIRHKIISFIYRRTEVLQGRWIDLKPARKVFVATTVSFSIIIYIICLGLVRALNSTTLSINAFSTLGFGAIPVKGVSRYITIIEGFLGWFLLSIFSVSLISQMLQN